MRFDRLALQNFKSFADAEVDLGVGVTVIHGLNGSGKSSLLEAAFFALYGARALDRTLEDIVTIGTEETAVDLWFTHDGGSHHVRRRVSVRDSGTQTVECVLEGPEGTWEGATDVRSRIADLLRMDSKAFVNCAYVRQGEVNKLINASPSERQDMLDELLQLGKLETYRERASDARLGVKRVRDDKQGALSQLSEQIAVKEEKDLHEQLNDRETELNGVSKEIERFEDNREEAIETREEAIEVLETFEEKRAELSEVEKEIDTLREQISETASERDRLAERMQEIREKRSDTRESTRKRLGTTDLDLSTPGAVADDAIPETLETISGAIDRLQETAAEQTERIRELSVEKQQHDGEAESLRETAADLTARADEKRAEATDLEDSIETDRKQLETKREELAELGEQLERIEETFSDAPISLGEAATYRERLAEAVSEKRREITGLETTIESEREAIEEARELLAAGKCPECGQDVRGAPQVESIEEDEAALAELETELVEHEDELAELLENLEEAERLADLEAEYEQVKSNQENLSQLLAEREDTLEERAERVETLREEAEELDSNAEEKRGAATEAEALAEEKREAIGEVNQEQADLRERIQRLETLLEELTELSDLADQLERLEERREEKGETNDQRRERLAEKRERKSQLADTIEQASVEEAREDRARAEEYIEEVDERLEALGKRRDELQAAIGGIENEIEELESLREQHAALAATVEDLESLYDEAESLQEMYGTLRAELRQRNVEILERMLNETFELIYENDAYSHIELDGSYRLTIYQKDGEPLEPEQLSGGERALFNLSLRSAIYRLLAEGIEGTAPMPPLILDEPTVFLDAGHVSQLVELVEHMRTLGVEQLLVVSHDEELVGAADDLVTVRKDATTNRSSLERGAGTEDALLTQAD